MARPTPERVEEIRQDAEGYDADFGVDRCACPPLMCRCDHERVSEAACQRRELLAEIDALKEELAALKQAGGNFLNALRKDARRISVPLK